MLWLISTVAAETVLIPSADAESLFEALGTASDGDVFLLTKDYAPSMEDQTAVTGVLVDRSVTIASDVEGEPRPAPGLLIDGVDVTLRDLEPQVIIGAFGNARGSYGVGLERTGAVVVLGGSVDLERVTFSGLERSSITWAPLLVLDADVTGTDVEISDCTPSSGGFVPWAGYGVVVEVDDNQAHQVDFTRLDIHDDDMAGVWLEETDGALTVTVADSDFDGLVARDSAPGIQGDNVTLTMENSEFRDLSSSLGAGALACTGCTLALRGLEFQGTTGFAGAIDVQGSNVSMQGVDFTDCDGQDGGALTAADSLLVLNEVVVNQCRADTGAVAHVKQGSLRAVDMGVVDAQADKGGLFWLDAVTSASFTRLAVCRVQTSNGGAIRGAAGSPVTLENTVFQHMTGNGMIDMDGTLDMQNVTVVGNAAGFLVGIPQQVRLVNVLFADNAALGELFLEQVEVHDNLYWNNATELSLGSQGAGTPAVTEDPRFRTEQPDDDCLWLPLLGAGSPAIDAGDALLLDADGTRSDIGAFGGENAWAYEPVQDTGGDSGWVDSGDPEASLPALGGGCPGVLPASLAGLLVLPWLTRRRRT
jgi:hypothetical protein